MDLFWLDRNRDIEKSYDDLIEDLNLKNEVKKYINYDNPYKIYLDLIYSIISEEDVELLDSDFTEKEIKELGISTDELDEKIEGTDKEIDDFEGLIEDIKEHGNDWSLSLYTGGTTGTPKKISHSIDSLTRNVKESERFRDYTWAFAYNPTHFAGLQVFFQAFFNKNPMIYIFETKGTEVGDLLSKYEVTNISATPTFYRTKALQIDEKVPSVKGLTLGGEKFDPLVKEDLKDIFPNASFRNIYASTEAGSLFGSKDEYFEIEEDHKEYIDISEDGELLIHEELLGESDDYDLKDGWFHTGDMVEKIDDNKFRFVSRESDLINVGGYQVNPYQVEKEIKKIDGVIDVLVKGRSSKVTGNILVADIKKDDSSDEDEIKEKLNEQLSENLQRWKVPRIFNFVDEIEKSRAGKKVRK